MDKIPFDYQKHQNETTIKAISDIYKILGENAELMTNTPETDMKEVNKNQSIVCEKIIQALSSNNVPLKDLPVLTDTISSTIFMIFSQIKVQLDRFENEFLALSYESRNPGDNHFSKEYATVDNLFNSLNKKRAEHKDDEYGYFYITKDAGEETE